MRATSDKLREIWGKKFKLVKNGLDEDEVSSFISELTEVNSELTSKLEHLSALTQLAESTVVEAEKQAKIIMTKTEEEAKSQAASIIIHAERQAISEGDKIIAESKQRAEDIAQKRIASAELQAEETIRDAEARACEVKKVAEEEASKVMASATQNAKNEALVIAKQANQLLKRSRKMAELEIAEKFKKVCDELISSVGDVSDDK